MRGRDCASLANAHRVSNACMVGIVLCRRVFFDPIDADWLCGRRGCRDADVPMAAADGPRSLHNSPRYPERRNGAAFFVRCRYNNIRLVVAYTGLREPWHERTRE